MEKCQSVSLFFFLFPLRLNNNEQGKWKGEQMVVSGAGTWFCVEFQVKESTSESERGRGGGGGRVSKRWEVSRWIEKSALGGRKEEEEEGICNNSHSERSVEIQESLGFFWSNSVLLLCIKLKAHGQFISNLTVIYTGWSLRQQCNQDDTIRYLACKCWLSLDFCRI